MSSKIDKSDSFFFHEISVNPSTAFALCKANKDDENSNIKELSTCVTSKRTGLFLKFVQEGILDLEGNLIGNLAKEILPPLSDEEVKCISEELEKPFAVEIGENHKITTSMGAILFSLFSNGFGIKWGPTKVIGGYVRYILFTKTNYAKRVFEQLKISHLYEENLFKKDALPPDFDLKTEVQHAEAPIMIREDLEYIRDQITFNFSQWFSQWFLHNKQKAPFSRIEAQHKISETAFKEPPLTIYSGLNKFQTISLKNTPFELNFYNALSRQSVFTLDDLYLDISSLILKGKNPILVESFNKKPLECFFHMYLGLIKAEHINTIDDRALLRLNSLSTRGYFPIASIEKTLFKKALEKTEFAQFQDRVGNWIKKHHPNNPLEVFALLFKKCQSFTNCLPGQANLESFWTLLDPKKIEDRFAFLIFDLITTKKIPFEIVESFLQVACFLSAAKNLKAHKGIQATIGCMVSDSSNTKTFIPHLELKICDQSLQFDFDPTIPLRNVQSFVKEHPDDWRKIEPVIKELYSFLIPPHDENPFQIPYNFSSFEKPFSSLLFSSFPFLQNLALQFYFSSKQVEEQKKWQLAERHFLTQLRASEDKKGLKKQFDPFIGKNDLLIEDADVEKKWISFLFHSERKSEETAYEIWKAWFEQTSDVLVTFTIIKELSSNQPDYASRLFAYLKKHNKLASTSSDAYETIMSCLQVVSNLSKRTFSHESFVDYLGQLASELLGSKGFKAPRKEKLFSQSFITFAKWFKKRNNPLLSAYFLKTGINNPYLLPADREIALSLQLELKFLTLTPEVKMASNKMEKLVEKIKNVDKGCSASTKFDYLLLLLQIRFKNGESLYADLFNQFLELVCQNAFGERNKEHTLEVIVQALESAPIFSNSPLLKSKEKIELGLKLLFDETISENLKRRVITQCYIKKLSIPNITLYLNTLCEWCGKTKSDQIEELQHLFNIFTDIELRGCQEEALMDKIRMALVDVGVTNPTFHKRSLKIFDQISISQDNLYRTLLLRLLSLSSIETKRKLDWFDAVCKKDTSLQPFFLESIVSLCDEVLEKKENIGVLVVWLSKSKFIEACKKEKIHPNTFLCLAFSEEIENQCKNFTKETLKALELIFNNYLEDLTILKSRSFFDFIRLVGQHDPSKLYEVFEKFQTSQLRSSGKFSSEEDFLYLPQIETYVLKQLKENNNPQALNFVRNYEKNAKLREGYPDFLLNYDYHCTLLQTAELFFEKIEKKELEDIISLVNIIFQNARKRQIELMKLNRVEGFDTLFIISSAINSFSYITFLFSTKRKQEIDKAVEILNQVLKQEATSLFWNLSAPLVNLLISFPNGEFANQVEIMTARISDASGLDLDKVIPFLSHYGQLNGVLTAARFWCNDIGKKLKIHATSWKYAKDILDVLVHSNSRAPLHWTKHIIETCVSQRKLFAGLGDSYQASLLYYDLIYNINILPNQSLDDFTLRIVPALNNMKVYCPLESRLLKVIEMGVAAVCQYDEKGIAFQPFVNLFYMNVVVATKQTKNDKNKLLLSEAECFDVKAELLKDLIRIFIYFKNDNKNLKGFITHKAIELQKEFPKKVDQIEELMKKTKIDYFN